MIFVTVGTHEQPFNRLIKCIDDLKASGFIKEEVFMQIGYSTYLPKYCNYSKFINYDDMNFYFNKADIIITHGGPSSFIVPVSLGKVPIVVPRQKKYNEHVNDHQLIFCNELVKRGFPIICINDIAELKENLTVRNKISSFVSNNQKFVNNLEQLISDLYEKN